MADPLSIAAGVIGIAATAAQLANSIYGTITKMANAPLEMSEAADNMTFLSSIFLSVGEELDRKKGTYKDALVEQVKFVLQKFDVLRLKAQKIFERPRRGSITTRLLWYIQSGKLREMLLEIEALKSALQLVLQILHLPSARDMPATAGRFRELVGAVIRQNRQSILKIENYQYWTAYYSSNTAPPGQPENDATSHPTAESKPSGFTEKKGNQPGDEATTSYATNRNTASEPTESTASNVKTKNDLENSSQPSPDTEPTTNPNAHGSQEQADERGEGNPTAKDGAPQQSQNHGIGKADKEDAAMWLYRFVFAQGGQEETASKKGARIENNHMEEGTALSSDIGKFDHGATLRDQYPRLGSGTNEKVQEHAVAQYQYPNPPMLFTKLQNIEVTVTLSNLLKEWMFLSPKEITAITSGGKIEDGEDSSSDDSEPEPPYYFPPSQGPYRGPQISAPPPGLQNNAPAKDLTPYSAAAGFPAGYAAPPPNFGQPVGPEAHPKDFHTPDAEDAVHHDAKRRGELMEMEEHLIKLTKALDDEKVEHEASREIYRMHREVEAKQLEKRHAEERMRMEKEAEARAASNAAWEARLRNDIQKAVATAEAKALSTRSAEMQAQKRQVEEIKKGLLKEVLDRQTESDKRTRELEAKIRQETIAKYKQRKQQQAAHAQIVSSRAIAQYKAEVERERRRDVASYEVATELVEALFEDSKDDTIVATKTKAQLAHEKLKEIQERRRAGESQGQHHFATSSLRNRGAQPEKKIGQQEDKELTGLTEVQARTKESGATDGDDVDDYPTADEYEADSESEGEEIGLFSRFEVFLAKQRLEEVHESALVSDLERILDKYGNKAKGTNKKKKNSSTSIIKLKDAVGRNFTFPFDRAATWTGMHELLKHAFLHVDALGAHVRDGHFDLVGPTGDIILPVLWDTLVEPGMSITMTMWPMKEPKPPSPPPPLGLGDIHPGTPLPRRSRGGPHPPPGTHPPGSIFLGPAGSRGPPPRPRGMPPGVPGPHSPPEEFEIIVARNSQSDDDSDQNQGQKPSTFRTWKSKASHLWKRRGRKKRVDDTTSESLLDD